MFISPFKIVCVENKECVIFRHNLKVNLND